MGPVRPTQDVFALTTCRQVCRLWREYVDAELFKSVNFYYGTAARPIKLSVKSRGYLVHNIKHLNVSFPGGSEIRDQQLILQNISIFSQITRLHFSGVRFTRPDPLLPFFSGLESLALTQCTFIDPLQLACMVGSTTQLQTLSVASVRFNINVVSTAFFQSFTFEALQLDESFDIAIIYMMISSFPKDGNCLRTLNLSAALIRDNRLFSYFLGSHHGRSLQHLEIRAFARLPGW